jgi:hypothetical protein
MMRLFVKELVVLLEPGFFTLPHIRKPFHFHDGLGIVRRTNSPQAST